jgi:hypothetical protein
MSKFKFCLLFTFIFSNFQLFAQFGYVTKSEIEKAKDARMVVVLFNDSAYNAAITKAVERYWKFNGGYIFVYDTSVVMKEYNKKPDYTYLVFSKSKISNKIKVKSCSAEPDINALLLVKKFKRKLTADLIIASGFMSNAIDTEGWYPEFYRAIQLMNNYFDLALMAESDKDISYSKMSTNYPTDKTLMNGKALYVYSSEVGLKGKEDGSTLLGDDFEDLEYREEVYKMIIDQEDALYYFSVKDEKYCNKLFVLANGSELMYFNASASKDECKCNAKDLKTLKSLKDKQ